MQPPAEGLASRLFLVPALRTQPDRRLVALVREGYETAFEEIVGRYGTPLSRYAASIVGDRSDDVLQDAFSKALLALRRDDAEIELRPWLFRIVRNTALNDLRDRPPSPEVLAEAIAGGDSPEEELERREELADLMRRLEALPDAQRAAIVMRELEGLSHEEIAAALGMTGGAARQAIYRARRALRDGIGMLVPLPLLQSMLAVASTSGVAETAAGAAGVGGAAGAGVGAGIALKATAATVLVAGAVGTGVALRDNPHSGDAKAASPAQVVQSGLSEAGAGPVASGGEGGSEDGDGGHGRGKTRHGDDPRSHGENEPADEHGGERESADDQGGSGENGPGADQGSRRGPFDHRSGSSGPGNDDRSSPSHGGGGSGSGGGGPDSSQGGSGSGDGNSLNSGPGSAGGDDPDLGGELSGGDGPRSGDDPPLEDGSSGSGSSGSEADLEPGDDHSGPG